VGAGSLHGTVVSSPYDEKPFTFFYCLNRSELAHNLTFNNSGLWSLNIPCSIGLQKHPMVLNNCVFSLELHTTDLFGAPYSLGKGRGFLVFGETDEEHIKQYECGTQGQSKGAQ
jgi:hypothetical protein